MLNLMNVLHRLCLFIVMAIQNIPTEADVLRFGYWERSQVTALMKFNREYQSELEKLYGTYPNEVPEALAEAETLRRAYDALDDAMFCVSETSRIQGLIRLRKIIGPESYNAGKMPPAVPLWRFRAIR